LLGDNLLFLPMSTRQLRITNKDQIRQRLQEFSGKKINIVLNDQTVCLVTVEKSDGSVVTVENMRLKKTDIAIDTINEIYFDVKE
jgi:hypothetical protein